jgi:2,4-dienoyl-CoA reductase-like NADH-dependent reductase (Old Yellow Enzyme family)
VCAVGRITSPAMAADMLAKGDADLIGMVRAHIADPDLLAKARAGRSRDIRPCVGPACA